MNRKLSINEMMTILVSVVALFGLALLTDLFWNEPTLNAQDSPTAAVESPLAREREVVMADEIGVGYFPTMFILVPESPFEDRELRQSGIITLHCPNFAFEGVPVEVRGRGNSTWWDGPDKRPLRFRFDEAQSLMGSSHEARNWILLSNHFDFSLLRNYSALHYGALLDGMSFVPSIHNVHLYVNGEYMGVYLITDERDVNPGRLEIEWDENPEYSGFFLELDARAYQGGAIENEDFIVVNSMLYDIRFPSSSQLTPEHVNYVWGYLNDVSRAIRYGTFDEILELIDLDSFVDFYIVQEVFKNADVHFLSVFMYIDGIGDERRLFKGPIWDFDIAAGNYANQPMGYGADKLYVAVVNYWYRHLMSRPEFKEAVTERWNTVAKQALIDTIDHIEHISRRYQAEFERNFERHPNVIAIARNTGAARPPVLLAIDSFIGQADYLIGWLGSRGYWLDNFFNDRIANYDPLWALVEYHMSDSPIIVNLNGESKHFRIPPIMLQRRIIATLQEMSAIFDLTIVYDQTTGLVSMIRDDISILHHVGTSVFVVNGEGVNMGIPSILVQDQIFAPMTVITDALGYNIEWIRDESTVFITD